MAERLVAAVPGARLVEIPGAYHHLVLDQPEAFAGELGRFLNGLDVETGRAGASPSARPGAA
jgi:pimeloyl-ACP methyl ester carboxylesterase